MPSYVAHSRKSVKKDKAKENTNLSTRKKSKLVREEI